MKTDRDSLLRYWGRFTLLLALIIMLAACGQDEATSTPVPPADTPTVAANTPAPASTTEEPASAPESPLAQPDSPLAQPDSPLTTAATPPPSSPKSEEEAVALASETTIPEPVEGMGAIGGVIYSYGIREAVVGTSFYLTVAEEVDGEFVRPEVLFGPHPETGDVAGRTNMQGQFQIDNIPAGNYYMFLWTVYDWLAVYPSEGASQPLLITVKEGDQLNLGVLYTNWP
jgi:hypothetical protein